MSVLFVRNVDQFVQLLFQVWVFYLLFLSCDRIPKDIGVSPFVAHPAFVRNFPLLSVMNFRMPKVLVKNQWFKEVILNDRSILRILDLLLFPPPLFIRLRKLFFLVWLLNTKPLDHRLFDLDSVIYLFCPLSMGLFEWGIHQIYKVLFLLITWNHISARRWLQPFLKNFWSFISKLIATEMYYM